MVAENYFKAPSQGLQTKDYTLNEQSLRAPPAGFGPRLSASLRGGQLEFGWVGLFNGEFNVTCSAARAGSPTKGRAISFVLCVRVNLKVMTFAEV